MNRSMTHPRLTVTSLSIVVNLSKMLEGDVWVTPRHTRPGEKSPGEEQSEYKTEMYVRSKAHSGRLSST